MDSPVASPAFPPLSSLPSAVNGARLAVQERCPGVARVMTRRGQGPALHARIGARYGIDLPGGPRFVAAGDVGFAGVGPGAWLAIRDDAAADFAGALARDLAGAASVADQSGAYATLRMSGPGAVDVLAAGPFIDFHPDVFPAGGVAVTTMALIDTVIIRRGDAVFDVTVFRSFAPDFWRFVEETAAAWRAPLARG